MACPNCDHTMHSLAICADEDRQYWWCPRCGTLRFEDAGNVNDATPKIVERCRKFQNEELAPSHLPGSLYMAWHRLGIAESINITESR